MNSRGRSQFSKSYLASGNNIYANISFGASGAPTLVAGTGMGIASIVRSSAGRYVITFNQASPALILARPTFINATAPAAPAMFIAANAVSTASAPSITVQFNNAGTATDPASGEVCLMHIMLNDSSLSY